MAPRDAAGVQRDDREAGARQLGGQVLRRGGAQHAALGGRRDGLEDGAPREERDGPGGERRQQLRQVLGDARVVAADLRGLGGGERERDCRRPALGAPDEAADLAGGERDAHAPGVPGGGGLVEREVARAEAQQPPLGGEPAERQVRRLPARECHLRAGRQAADRAGHQARHVAARAHRRAVQHQDHGLRAPGGRGRHRLGDGGVEPPVGLDPGERPRVGVGPVRQQRGLPVARRGLDHHERDVGRGDEALDQHGPDHVAGARPRRCVPDAPGAGDRHDLGGVPHGEDGRPGPGDGAPRPG